MVFSSITFLFYFLPLFFALYYALPFRNAVLLVASLVFYSWGEARRLPILLLSIAGNYLCGLAIAAAIGRGRRGRLALAIGVALNLAVLGYFKYTTFLVGSLASLLSIHGLGWGRVLGAPPYLDPIALPLGISFFTFHSISYLVDVYRRKTDAERDPQALATYITMFPQLVAGPIIRYATVAKQLHRRRSTPARTRLGLELFIAGLAQKVLLANTLALPTDQIFAIPPDLLPPSTAWLGIVGYTLQIYFDFAGYSNMAIGLGLMTGFSFPRNFAYPYIAESVTDFWHRWHLSLSRWFRDYLYIPLGGNRVSPGRTYFNLFAVFLLCGLWHGANWTFAAWGLYHGLFLVLERAGLGAALGRMPRPLRHAYALGVVMAGWVLFRADTLSQAIAYGARLAGHGAGDGLAFPVARYLTPSVEAALVLGVIAAIPIRRALQRALEPIQSAGAAEAMRWAGAAGTIALLLLAAAGLAGGTYNPFIYFRF